MNHEIVALNKGSRNKLKHLFWIDSFRKYVGIGNNFIMAGRLGFYICPKPFECFLFFLLLLCVRTIVLQTLKMLGIGQPHPPQKK